jgi:alcohol dehydrogenase class IV
MWFFKSPEIAFGEDALSYLQQLEGKRAFIVTDAVVAKLGHATRVEAMLRENGFDVTIFDQVESDPSVETARRGAALMMEFQPDWIIGLGGGSALDAAKGMWVLYERPDADPHCINPLEPLHLRRKARFITIPTTSGTGSDVTWFIVLTDLAERRKMGMGNREAVADIAIVDPTFVMSMPPRVTADTGLDVLTQAVEAFICTWHNDFTDGLALKAAQIVFEYLPRAYKDGSDLEARTKMHNAASIAGLAFGNAFASLAHGMGHALGASFHVPHGRAVSLFLPYTIEFYSQGDVQDTRYGDLARYLSLSCFGEREAAMALVAAIRELQTTLDAPRSIAACNIAREDLEREMERLITHTLNDNQTVTSPRFPDDAEMRRLFEYAYEGRSIDF